MNSNKKNKNKNKIPSIIKIFLVLFFVVVTPNYVYASAVNTTTLTESEIKEAIDNRGDGDIPTQAYLILWFFVAFGFLKVSQKMDSHLSSLGINVGQTGGSLIGEAVSVAKGLQSAASGFNSKGGGSSSMFGGSDIAGKKGAGFLQGGLAGAIGRKTFQSGQTVATGGSASTLGGSKFTRELESGSGDFANSVIGSIAQGNLKNDGSITGETASKAMNSYFGLDKKNTASTGSSVSSTVDKTSANINNSDELTSGMSITSSPDGSFSIPHQDKDSNSSTGTEDGTSNEYSSDSGLGFNSDYGTDTNVSDEGLMESIPYEQGTSPNSDFSLGSQDQGENQNGDFSIPYSSESREDGMSSNGFAEVASEEHGSDESNPTATNFSGDMGGFSDFSIPYSQTASESSSRVLGGSGDSSTSSTSNTNTSVPSSSADIGNSSHVQASSMPQNTTIGGIGVENTGYSGSGVGYTGSSSGSSVLNADPTSSAGGFSIPDNNSSSPNPSGFSISDSSSTAVDGSSSSYSNISVSESVSSKDYTKQESYNQGDNYTATGGFSEQISGMSDTLSNSNNVSIPPTQPVQYTNVEMGGGHITGTEITPDNPQGVPFAMYHTGQYLEPPKGDFTIMSAVDGSKWYKQYTMDTVEKTPYKSDGKIKYKEEIVKKLPPPPKKKDKI